MTTARSAIEVLHVIHCVTRGGASLAMSALAVRTARQPGRRVRAISLTPPHRREADRLAGAGVEVVATATFADARRAIAGADIVHVHAWNSPELYELLSGELPPCRLLLWFHVAGRALPQVFSRVIVGRGDIAVATCREALERLAAFDVPDRLPAQLVFPTPELPDFSSLQPASHDGIRIGYVGMLDETKLHPDVMSLCARVVPAGARFVFVGDGPLREGMERQAAALGIEKSVTFAGFVDDVRPYLANFDMLGFPFAPGAMAAADLAVIEGMAAGVPPVVMAAFRYDPVDSGRDGLVARDPDEYVAMLTGLVRDADRRRTLAHAAREGALRKFDPAATAARFDAIYDSLLARPKATRARLSWSDGRTTATGADAFLLSVGDAWPALEESFSRRGAAAAAPDAEIAEAGSPWLGRATGGLLHYLGRYPTDPWLLFWRALSLAGRGRHVRAVAVLAQAVDSGFPDAARAAVYRATLLAALNLSGVISPAPAQEPGFSDRLRDQAAPTAGLRP